MFLGIVIFIYILITGTTEYFCKIQNMFTTFFKCKNEPRKLIFFGFFSVAIVLRSVAKWL